MRAKPGSRGDIRIGESATNLLSPNPATALSPCLRLQVASGGAPFFPRQLSCVRRFSTCWSAVSASASASARRGGGGWTDGRTQGRLLQPIAFELLAGQPLAGCVRRPCHRRSFLRPLSIVLLFALCVVNDNSFFFCFFCFLTCFDFMSIRCNRFLNLIGNFFIIHR
jgi:hypothetical protein